MSLREVARRGSGHRAHGCDANRAADLPARIDQTRRDAGVGAIDSGETRNRHRDERKSHAGAAKHEPREQIPEVVSVHWQPRQPCNRDRGNEQTGGEGRSHTQASDDDLRDVRHHNDRERKTAEGGPGP